MTLTLISAFFAAAIGLVAGFSWHRYQDAKKIDNANQVATNILEQANSEAKSIQRAAEVDAKDLAQKYRTEVENSLSDRQKQVQQQEGRLQDRIDTLDQKDATLNQRDASLIQKENQVQAQLDDAKQKQAHSDEILKRQQSKLEEIAQLTHEDAQKIVLSDAKD